MTLRFVGGCMGRVTGRRQVCKLTRDDHMMLWTMDLYTRQLYPVSFLKNLVV